MSYLYCIRLVGSDIAKVGVTGDLRSRIQSVRGITPFEVDCIRALQVSSQGVAAAWERYILARAERFCGRGEWVVFSEGLLELFDEVCPAVLIDVAAEKDAGRKISQLTDDDLFKEIHRAQLKAQVGPVAACGLPHATTPTEYTRNVVLARLREGYGAQDVLVMDGIPESVFWEVVRMERAA